MHHFLRQKTYCPPILKTQVYGKMAAENTTLKQQEQATRIGNTNSTSPEEILDLSHYTCQDLDKAKQLTIYKKNIRALQKYHPAVFAQLGRVELLVENIFKTPEGWLNARVQGNNQHHTLHANIKDEVAQPLSSIQNKSHTVLCLIGGGLGYPLLILNKHRTSIQRFILVEPILEILQMSLITTELHHLLADPRLTILAGDTPITNATIENAIQQLQFEDCYIYTHKPTWHLSDAYDIKAKQMYTLTNELNMSGSTMIAMGHLFMENRFANLTMMPRAKNLSAAKGLCTNRPAVLVTAGPSLDKNIQILKKYEDGVCIICADSAFPTLLQHNITPDFITSLDPQKMVFEKLSQTLMETARTTLICSMGVCPKITKYFPFQHLFFAFNQSNIEKLFATLAKSHPQPTPADSSPHLSLQAALIMEASPLIFIGHDLAYTGEKSHAEHTAIPTDLKAIQADKQGDNPDVVWTEDIYGNQIKTTRSFLNSKAHFEEILRQQPGVYINATEGGIGINGTRVATLADSLAAITQNDQGAEPQEDINSIEHIDITRITSHIDSLRKDIVHSLKKTKELQELAKKLQRILPKSGPTSFAGLNKKSQRLLTRHDKINQDMHQDMTLFNLVDEITVAGLRDANRLQTTIHQMAHRPYIHQLRAILKRSKLITDTFATALTKVNQYCTTFLDFQANAQEHQELWKQINAHMAVDNIARARELLAESLQQKSEKSGEFYFHMGCIAAKQLQPTAMHHNFKKACERDTAYQSKVADIKEKMHLEFLEELYYALPAVKETLTLRQLKFWGKLHLSPAKLRQFIAKSTPLSPAHAMMAKEELIMQGVSRGYRAYATYKTKEGDQEETLHLLQTALDFYPDNDDAHMDLVQEYFDQGDFAKALHHLSLAVKINPNHAESWQTIGDYLLGENQFTDARMAFENYHHALPQNREILLKIKICYEKEGQSEAAQQIEALYNSKTA